VASNSHLVNQISLHFFYHQSYIMRLNSITLSIQLSKTHLLYVVN